MLYVYFTRYNHVLTNIIVIKYILDMNLINDLAIIALKLNKCVSIDDSLSY